MDGQFTRIARGRGHSAPPVAIAVAVLTLVIAALAACDPGYPVSVRNETDMPLMLSGPDSPITEKWRRLAPNQEIKLGVLKAEKKEPIFDLVASDPEGRQVHIVLTRAELEARDYRVIIRSEDFASLAPAAPR